MATSENLGLYLPTRDDYISVKRDISDNMEIIDAAVGQNIADIEKVGTATVIEATSIETLKTNLLNAVNSIEISDMIAVRIAPSFSSNGFTSGSTYGGYAFNIYKSGGTTNYFSCILSNNIGEDMIVGYNNGNWFFKPVSNAIQSADTVVQNITGVKNALMNFANQMDVGESKLVRIVHTDNGDTNIMRPSVRYAGYLTKNYINCFSWLASGYLEKEPVIFTYFSDSQYWVVDKIAVNSKLITSIVDAGVINSYNADFGTASKISVAILPSGSSNTPWNDPNTSGYMIKFGRAYGRDLAISQDGVKTRSVLNGVVGNWTDL